MGDGVKRVEEREIAVMKKLRRVGLKAWKPEIKALVALDVDGVLTDGRILGGGDGRTPELETVFVPGRDGHFARKPARGMIIRRSISGSKECR